MFKKFGPLADETTKRIESSTLEELDRYTGNVVTATTVEDVFR